MRTRKAKRALAARGLVEAVTWSFIAKPQAELFGGGKPELALANPIAADLSDMRPSLIPGLVAAAQTQCRPRLSGCRRCSRSARCSAATAPQDQLTAAAGVRRALAKPSGIGRHWSKRDGEVDAFDAKADALAVLAAAGAPPQALQVVPGGPAWLHPGRSGTIQIGPQNVLGYFGELHPRALEALDAEGPLVAFEVILERIPEPKAKATRAKPALELSPFQPVERDFAFVVDRGVKAADIVRAAQRVDRKLITGVTVFDVYEGQGIEPGKKSIAIAVTHAAARQDHDRRRRSRRWRQRSSPRSASAPAACCGREVAPRFAHDDRRARRNCIAARRAALLCAGRARLRSAGAAP